ncbi:MAG: hypothetical protein WC438_01470 [Candidatus Pacearchaeota archaeon]
MFPQKHILINLIISLIFLLFMPPTGVLIFFLSSFLIDVDHYIYYVIVKRKLSLKSAYNWFKIKHYKSLKLSVEERKKHRQCIIFLHGIEPLLVIFLLSKVYPLLIYVVLGFTVHLIEDLYIERKLGTAMHKVSLIYSIYDHILKRKLKLFE